MSLLFVPEKLKKSQKNSLMMLKSMINPEQNFSCIVSGDEYNLENVKYNEILNFLDIAEEFIFTMQGLFSNNFFN